jgi:glc operon protein GlcG
MFKREVLGLKEARAAMTAILEAAEKNPERPIAAAIVDHQGEIVCAFRMDGATPFFNYMAVKKAKSSATTGYNTRDWYAFLEKRGYTANDFVPEATRIPGGVAIAPPDGDPGKVFLPGERFVLGGIGVSGRSGNEDEALSLVGLEALQKGA